MTRERLDRPVERRRGLKGGPSGSIPPKPPTRGGRGYSHDDGERSLEWEFDQAAQLLTNNPNARLDDLHEQARALQAYREKNGITGRLDERAGKPFDDDERLIVERLLAEGKNVSSISETRTVQGRRLPDMFVNAELAEIKTSTKGNARAFGSRVSRVQDEQHASHTYVNAVRSGIDRSDLESQLSGIVQAGNARDIPLIGEGFDVEFGRW